MKAKRMSLASVFHAATAKWPWVAERVPPGVVLGAIHGGGGASAPASPVRGRRRVADRGRDRRLSKREPDFAPCCIGGSAALR